MERVVTAIEAGMGRDHIGAQLHAVHRGRVVADLAVGDAAEGVAMSASTLMPWHSLTKVVTAVTVARQWEQGRLELDDPVARHVPEFAANGKEQVTIRHLLTHTAGLRAVGLVDQPEDPVALLDQVYSTRLKPGWVPGRRAAYHGRGSFEVLGEVVARKEGRPWSDVVHEDVFEPLGMADSWVSLPPERHAAYGAQVGVMHTTAGGGADGTAGADGAASADGAGGRLRPVAGAGRADFHADALPSRSGVGPMRDVVRIFRLFLERGRLDGQQMLSPQTVEAMTARHRTAMRDETFGAVIDWGLGIMVDSKHYTGAPTPYGYGVHSSRRAAGHGGAESSLGFFDPEHDLAVALVFNGMPGEDRNHRRMQDVVTRLYEDLGLASPEPV